ncbi:MAG: hypothetical protein Q9162_005385 [Coniocarpon cinnabarinum]
MIGQKDEKGKTDTSIAKTDVRSPPRAPRGPRRGSNEGKWKHEEFDRDMRDSSGQLPKDKRDRLPAKKEEDVDIMDIDPFVDSEEAFRTAMRQAMGFGMFRTTKNTKVPGNDKLYAVRKERKTEYRQYMNRQGGFNRPLSPTR